MKEETRLAKEAEERGEDIPPPPTESPENSATLGDASPVSASDLVADDTDRPKADNKLPPPTLEGGDNAPQSDAAPNVSPPPEQSKRGRPKMTPEQKAQAKAIREAVRAGKPPPNFSDLPGSVARTGTSNKPPRDYYMEACNLFIPCSMMAGKMLGPHWAVPFVEKEIQGLKQTVLEPTDEQKQYLANMARWLEYEQFPELNPRWAFLIASAAYAAPKLKTDPTPERLQIGWEWIRVKILRRQPNPERIKK